MKTPIKLSTKLIITSIIVGLSPLISAFTASAIATLNHCELNEGSVHACVILSFDLGDALYAMFVAGWYMFFSIPFAIASIVALIIYKVMTKN